jgi:phage shock protein PspC (stress-responsive transcriptional regulator)
MNDKTNNTMLEHPDQWLRAKDGIISGVCKGIAQRLEVDPWLIRLAWLASVLIFGAGLALYIVLSIGLTREDRIAEANTKKILGVCLRICQNAQVDVGMVRVLTLVSALMSLGVVVLVYLVLHFFMPWPHEIRDAHQGHPIR